MLYSSFIRLQKARIKHNVNTYRLNDQSDTAVTYVLNMPAAENAISACIIYRCTFHEPCALPTDVEMENIKRGSRQVGSYETSLLQLSGSDFLKYMLASWQHL